MNESAKPPRKKFAVQLSTGRNDVGKVKSALMFATIAQCSGCDAVVYCVQDGADAVTRGGHPGRRRPAARSADVRAASR